jgi:quercetin dioxygenase-like cupin family protein
VSSVPTTFKLTPRESVTVRASTPEALEVEAAYGPGGSPPPGHFHPEQDEHFEVLEGELTARVEGDERRLRTGDTLDIPRRAVHQMWNAGAQPARVLWRTSPAGRTLEWFATLDRLQREGRADAKGRPSPLAMAVYLTEYKDVFRLAAGPAPLMSAALTALAPLGRLRGYRVERPPPARSSQPDADAPPPA